ncbi:zf-HC2 domain-containing protein [Candidatus Deferrimicrobium sp.]|uniref:zf-HC2 domain-containing protein n=1 Tax=Candidatus Deferrimicrobium sp. TaxID=3060586 RepID=UPI002ED9C57E
MECRETQTLLTAFHDGELPAADRARVEEHLRGCLECGALLTGLARADQSAGVPDPGPGYWDRFNARVMDRVDREADGPGAAILRPKHGWMRQQLRYLVPAAAAAALVVVVVRYGGMHPGAPAPAVPPAVSERGAPVTAGQRTAKADPESDGQGWPSAGAGRDATGSKAPARAPKKAESPADARRVPPPAIEKERFASVTREERDRPADRSLPAANETASRDRAAEPASIRSPSPPATAADGIPPEMQAGRKKMAGEGPPMEDRQVAAKAESASGMRIAKEPSTGSPCEHALALAERERIRDAEVSQRACLGGDLDAPSRERGLVFLAELLDRQARFAEADAVIAEVDRRFPRSRPLDLYRQQRPMVQQLPKAVPVTR